MNSTIKISILLWFTFAITSCQSQPLRLNSIEFEKAISQKEVQLVDIRTQGEFANGHLKNAINIDFYSTDFISKINQLDKSKPLYIYCASGNRSGKALTKLSELKFKALGDLQGGIHSWEASRKEIVK